MADRTIQILPGGQSSAPFTYTVPPSSAFELLGVRATFDGTGAGSAWLPAVQIVSDAGVEMIHTEGASVAAGGTADVAFFPWSRSKLTAGGVSYASQIILLKASYTCVAEWRLTEGSSPYADTSGFAPGDPATQVRQVRPIPMTQSFASGPLAEQPVGPSVAFNFDGDSLTNQGDFLNDTSANPARFHFAGNAIFTVVAWVLPGAGASSHYGPAVDNIVTSGGATDNGWRMNVNQVGAIPQFVRAPNVAGVGAYNTVTGSSLSTTAWHLLVGTYDGTNMRLYVDGSQVGQTASAGGIGGLANNCRLAEGAHSLGDYGTFYFGGLSQVSIWAATFTATDVANLWAAASV